MDFEDEARKLVGCTYSYCEPDSRCSKNRAEIVQALKRAHDAGAANGRSVVYEVHNKVMLLLFGTLEGAEAYMRQYACATNGMEMREVRLMDAPAAEEKR